MESTTGKLLKSLKSLERESSQPVRRSSTSTTPLGNETILQRLFTFLSTEDLKASRLVCHAWHSTATFELSTRIHPILLHDKVDWRKFMKIFSKSCSAPKMSKLGNIHPFHGFTFFATYPEDPSAQNPYKTAILDYMHTKYRIPRKTLWEARFFSTYGNQISELKFIQFNLYGEKALREFREMLSTHCPGLTALTLQFQKGRSQSGSDGGSSSTSTPTPSPSPSPLVLPGQENVFFPPDQDSQRKTLAQLKRFTLMTDNKVYLSPLGLEEFMALMPSLEEFTYRYTGSKKQWSLVRRVDVIDVLCNILNAGYYGELRELDLDSDGTVLSGEDFRKLVRLRLRQELKLRKFACQVFIKTEPDWESLCCWLRGYQETLEVLDIQVRTHFPQLLGEQELPVGFPRMRRAKLLLDSNLRMVLKRMPRVRVVTGVYENELVPLSEEHSFSPGSCSTASQTFQHMLQASSQTEPDLDENVRHLRIEDKAHAQASQSLELEDYEEGPSCPSATHLIIQGNEEFGLDVEWKSRVFPNITSFEAEIFFDTDLRLIWTHLQHVKRLILHLKTSVPEQAFTGAGIGPLPPSSFKGHGPEQDLHSHENLSKLEEYPNLSLMQRLEVLEIDTGSRQDAYGSHFSASLIVFGASLLKNLTRLVLPPAIPPKCLEESLKYLAKLREFRYLSVCDDTFNSVLPFHMLKLDVPNLEIVVRYYQPEVKRQVSNFWRLERFAFPDFLPEHGRKCMDKRHSAPS